MVSLTCTFNCLPNSHLSLLKHKIRYFLNILSNPAVVVAPPAYLSLQDCLQGLNSQHFLIMSYDNTGSLNIKSW